MSEDFQDYDTYNESWYISAEYWDCKPGYTDGGCTNDYSSTDPNTDASQYIKQESNSNKYLHLVATNVNEADMGDRIAVSVQYNLTSETNLRKNWSYVFDIRYNGLNTDLSLLTAEPVNIIGGFYYAGLDMQSFMEDKNPVNYNFHGGAIGGVKSTVADNFTRMRLLHGTSGTTGLPVNGYGGINNDECIVNDGDWHRITTHVEYDNVADIYNNTYVYVDGELCYTHTRNADLTAFSIKPLRIYNGGFFNIDVDNMAVYIDGFYPPEGTVSITGDFQCPASDCLFFDDFEYTNNTVLANVYNEYEGKTGSAYFAGNTYMFFNTTFTGNNQVSYIKSEKFRDNEDYNEVNSVSVFKVADRDHVPDALQAYPAVYRVTTYCDGTSLFTYNLAFFESEYSGYQDNYTFVNLYVLEDGNARVLGSKVMRNGDKFIVVEQYNKERQEISVDIAGEDNFKNVYNPQQLFNFDLPFKCNNIDGYYIGRRDIGFFNSTVDSHVLVDKSYYYGVPDVIEDEYSPVFEYTDEIMQNESIVEGEIGEYLHNAAFTLGFKSSTGKLTFWVIIMFFMMAVLLGSPAPAIAKTLGTLGIFLSMMTIGFFFGFVSTIIFIFLILAVVVITAIFISKIFSGGNIES